jgi:hypothetical protein
VIAHLICSPQESAKVILCCMFTYLIITPSPYTIVILLRVKQTALRRWTNKLLDDEAYSPSDEAVPKDLHDK